MAKKKTKKKKPTPEFEPAPEGHGPLVGDRRYQTSLGDGPERRESSLGDRARGGNR